MTRPPRASRAAALFAGSLALAVYAGAVFALSRGETYPLPAAAALGPGVCAALGAVFGFAWPAGSWRWGLWVSSPFWGFLTLSFLAFVAAGETEWLALAQALAVALSACAGARLGALWGAGRGPVRGS